MHRLCRLGLLLWLGLALALGQAEVAVHDLRHLAGELDRGDIAPDAPRQCEEHFACAQLASAVDCAPPAAVFLAAAPVRQAHVPGRSAHAAPRLAFRSRAPPAVPA